jgi:hypothetical protein
MDTDAIPWQARVAANEGRARALTTGTEPIEMTVTAVTQPFPIASCSPE